MITEMQEAPIDALDSLEAQITELAGKQARLEEQHADASKALRELQQRLADGACTADEVMFAQVTANVLSNAIEQLDAKLAPLRAQRTELVAMRAAEARHSEAVEAVAKHARAAEAHARGFIAARAQLEREVQALSTKAAAEMDAARKELRAAWTAARDRGVHLAVAREADVNLSLLAMVNGCQGGVLPWESSRDLMAYYDSQLQRHILPAPDSADRTVRLVITDVLDRVPR